MVNPLKWDHESPSSLPKVLVSQSGWNYLPLQHLPNHFNPPYPPESSLENPIGDVTDVCTGRGEASSHLPRTDQLKPPEKEGEDCCHAGNNSYFHCKGYLPFSSVFLLLFSKCGYLNAEFLQGMNAGLVSRLFLLQFSLQVWGHQGESTKPRNQGGDEPTEKKASVNTLGISLLARILKEWKSIHNEFRRLSVHILTAWYYPIEEAVQPH